MDREIHFLNFKHFFFFNIYCKPFFQRLGNKKKEKALISKSNICAVIPGESNIIKHVINHLAVPRSSYIVSHIKNSKSCLKYRFYDNDNIRQSWFSFPRHIYISQYSKKGLRNGNLQTENLSAGVPLQI